MRSCTSPPGFFLCDRSPQFGHGPSRAKQIAVMRTERQCQGLSLIGDSMDPMLETRWRAMAAAALDEFLLPSQQQTNQPLSCPFAHTASRVRRPHNLANASKR